MENYSHILTINVDEEEFDRDEVISIIYDKIHNQIIYKTILDINIPIKWIVSDDNDFTYYTDVEGLLGDKAVQLHTKLLLNDIQKIFIQKIHFTVTKPLTKKICML